MCKVSNLRARRMVVSRVYRFSYEGFEEEGKIPLGRLDYRGKAEMTRRDRKGKWDFVRQLGYSAG